MYTLIRYSLQYLRTATEHPRTDNPGDNCTSKMANVRGLLVLSLVCLLLCQMMSPSEACGKPVTCNDSKKCVKYYCTGDTVCNYSICGCRRPRR
ncbi:hypothetical protein LSAT2_011261 [Lamellibrachia satsuma]|nr:hypothetical protein LSAT2_011261 [Lamellibrachia satsuma]